MACPFGQIIVGPRGKAEKCDLCLGEPTCVEFCPSGALTYREMEKTRGEKGIYLAQKLKESFPGLQS
jgi:Fe-S-cluster-containing hydrogenase component 2